MVATEVIIGLVVMLFWGVGAFLQSILTRKLGAFKSQFVANLFVIIILVIALLFYRNLLVISFINLILLIISSFLLVFGLLSFYLGIEIGEVSVLSPISSSNTVITLILAFIFLKEEITSLKIISILLIMIGIFLISTDIRKIKHLKHVKGIGYAFISFLFQGIAFFILSVVNQDITILGINSSAPHFITVFFYSVTINALFFIGAALFKKEIPKLEDLKDNGIKIIFIINFFLFSFAWIIMNYGLSLGNVTLLLPVSSLSPAIMVILAMIFLKEKLVLNQKVGLLIVLFGLFLVSI